MKKAGDWILLGFAILASIPFIFANIVILVHRRRKLFQAQGGVDLVITGSIAGLIWITSSFVVNDHFICQGFLRQCVLWSLWLRITFGMCLWLLCLTLRLHRMFLLSKRSDGITWTHTLLVPLLLLPSVTISLLATKFGAFTEPEKVCCPMKSSWSYSMYFTVVPAYFSGLLIFVCLTRGEKDPMLTTEYKHTCEYTAMAFIIYLLSGETYLTKGNMTVEGRCFLTFCVCSLVFIHFWVSMRRPVYLCLFKPEPDVDDPEDSPRRAGAVHNCQIEMSSSEDVVLQVLEEVTVEAESLKIKVQKLELEKQELIKLRQLLEERKG